MNARSVLKRGVSKQLLEHTVHLGLGRPRVAEALHCPAGQERRRGRSRSAAGEVEAVRERARRRGEGGAGAAEGELGLGPLALEDGHAGGFGRGMRWSIGLLGGGRSDAS